MRFSDKIIQCLDNSKNMSDQISLALLIISEKFDELEDRIIALEADSDSKERGKKSEL